MVFFQATKKPGIPPWLLAFNALQIRLNLGYSNCLGTLGSRFYLEPYFFPLAQRPETVSNNSRVMDKHVTLILCLDETITLLVIEPLHATFRHFLDPFLLAVFYCCAVGLL
jgi:hypothetical protein